MNSTFPKTNYPHQEITKNIISAAFQVQKTLGWGLLEKLYERALIIELTMQNLQVTSQKRYPVSYYNQTIGNYYADLVVENKVIVEVKAVQSIMQEHLAQLLNYLRLANLQIGLIINFNKGKVDSKRVIL